MAGNPLKLVNRTRYPDAPIRRVLMLAKRAQGVTWPVTAIVSPGRGVGGHVTWDGVREFYVTLPRPADMRRCDPVAAATLFSDTAEHELAHLVQNVRGFRGSRPDPVSRRRPRWGKRPEEVDAQNRVWDAARKRTKAQRERRQEAIAGLAGALAGVAADRAARAKTADPPGAAELEAWARANPGAYMRDDEGEVEIAAPDGYRFEYGDAGSHWRISDHDHGFRVYGPRRRSIALRIVATMRPGPCPDPDGCQVCIEAAGHPAKDSFPGEAISP